MSLSFEQMTNALMRDLRWDRKRAEAEARRQLGVPVFDPVAEAKAERDARVREQKEQAEVVKTFKAFGFAVYNLSQARASKQTPGIADLWVMHAELAIAFYWETKRQVGGTFSRAQLDFAEACRRCRVGYGSGDRFAARTHLIQLGLARAAGETIEPIRAARRETARGAV